MHFRALAIRKELPVGNIHRACSTAMIASGDREIVGGIARRHIGMHNCINRDHREGTRGEKWPQ